MCRLVQGRLICLAVQVAISLSYNILADSVNKTPSVKRVVLTSSVAAVYGDPAERGKDHIFTEEDWALAPKEQYIPY